MSILEDIRSKLESKTDDGLSFECLEVSSRESEITGFRCYRNSQTVDLSKNVRLPGCMQAFIDSVSESRPGMRFFDYSERDNGTISVSFLIDKSTFDYSVLERRSVDPIRLVQFGYLIDLSGNVLETKEYYIIENVDQLDHPIIDADIHATILNHSYVPGLYGINSGPDLFEEKIYYKNAITTLEREEIHVAKDLIESLPLPGILSEITESAYAHGLILRGFGYSTKEWRFYFFRK